MYIWLLGVFYILFIPVIHAKILVITCLKKEKKRKMFKREREREIGIPCPNRKMKKICHCIWSCHNKCQLIIVCSFVVNPRPLDFLILLYGKEEIAWAWQKLESENIVKNFSLIKISGLVLILAIIYVPLMFKTIWWRFKKITLLTGTRYSFIFL